MATLYSTELTGIDSQPVAKPSAASGYNSTLKRFRATVPLAAQQINDIVHIARLPAGSVFAYGLLNTSVTLSTSQIAIGITGSTGKYRAAATFTTTDTPTLFGLNANVALTPYTAEEQIFMTVTALALPASGTLVVDIFANTP